MRKMEFYGSASIEDRFIHYVYWLIYSISGVRILLAKPYVTRDKNGGKAVCSPADPSQC